MSNYTKLPTHWRTKDNGLIDIKEMTDNHLLNSIAFYQKRAPDMQESDIYTSMSAAACFGKDSMASYNADGMTADAMGEATEDWLERQPLWRSITNEAKRRELNFNM